MEDDSETEGNVEHVLLRRNEYRDVVFEDATIVVDDCRFISCRMVNCRLVYQGGPPPTFDTDTAMDMCTFVFEGAAVNTLWYLALLNTADETFVDEILRDQATRPPPDTVVLPSPSPDPPQPSAGEAQAP
ncbi:MAG TPA: hypothetical protein VGB53_02690 [Rubricoccaceae bacterium]|jgi:hypothetical protein